MRRKPVPSIAAPASPQTPLPYLPFPTDRDLLTTTHNAVSICEAPGNLQKIYRSVHDCIGAATHSKAGLLAVADGRVVVIEAKGGTRARYHLKSGDGHVGVLAYANNLQHLFFSTTLRHAVQRYSIIDDRMLDWFCMHPSPPTVLAISTSSHYAVSASRHPPTTYLSLLDRQEPKHLLIRPHASVAGVTAASFHPDTEEHFLLAYADGTVSLHTALRIELMHASGSDGSIAFLKRAHRVTNKPHYRHAIKHQRGGSSVESAQVGAKSVSVTAAAFDSGCKLRVVTVAGDGKCRMIDFERGAQILRTWSITSSCTSLAIYVPQSKEPHDTSTRHIIAIGRSDGYVSLYDYAGILREEKLVDAAYRGIIGLEWVTRVATEMEPAAKAEEPEPFKPSFTGVDWKFAQDATSPPQSGDSHKATLSRVPVSTRDSRAISLLTSLRTPMMPCSGPKSMVQWPISPSSSAGVKSTLMDTAPIRTSTLPNSFSPLLRSLRQGRLKSLGASNRSARVDSPQAATQAQKMLPPVRPRTPGPDEKDPPDQSVEAKEETAGTERPKVEDDVHFEQPLMTRVDEAKEPEQSFKEPLVAAEPMPAVDDPRVAAEPTPAVEEHRVVAESMPAAGPPVVQAMTPRPSASSTIKRKGMPGSWVSESELTARKTSERQRPNNPRPQPSGSVRRSRSRPTVQRDREHTQRPTSPQKFRALDEAKNRPFKIEPERPPRDLSLGWETDVELSPVRRHQANRHRRLRRMTRLDNLALVEFEDRRDKLILPLQVDERRLRIRSPTTSSPPARQSSSSYSVADSQAPLTSTPVSNRRRGADHANERSSRVKPPRYYAQFLRRSRSKSSHDQHRTSTHHHRSPTDKPLPTDKSLPLLPPGFDLSPFRHPVSSPHDHDCDCADAVREEMALVRAEVASLRKAFWVFGARMEGLSLNGSGMPLSREGGGGVGWTGEDEDPLVSWRAMRDANNEVGKG